MLKVKIDQEWKKVVRRYQNVKALDIIDKGIALWGADLMVKQAKSEIDVLVYDAPLPPSAGPNYERTGRTRRAIKRDRMRGVPHNWAAFQAFVDKRDYEAYYYASILNYGGKPGGRMANYRARPFWNNAAKIVQTLFKRKGLAVMAEVKNALERS